MRNSNVLCWLVGFTIAGCGVLTDSRQDDGGRGGESDGGGEISDDQPADDAEQDVETDAGSTDERADVDEAVAECQRTGTEDHYGCLENSEQIFCQPCECDSDCEPAGGTGCDPNLNFVAGGYSGACLPEGFCASFQESASCEPECTIAGCVNSDGITNPLTGTSQNPCDEVDNNSNGEIDEWGEENILGSFCTIFTCDETTGLCSPKFGHVECDGRQPTCRVFCSDQEMTYGRAPDEPENTPDGFDSDCDGLVDEAEIGDKCTDGDEDDPRFGQYCETTACRGDLCAPVKGTLDCGLGALICIPDCYPSETLSNNLDDDCDGFLDEDGPDNQPCDGHLDCVDCESCNGVVCIENYDPLFCSDP